MVVLGGGAVSYERGAGSEPRDDWTDCPRDDGCGRGWGVGVPHGGVRGFRWFGLFLSSKVNLPHAINFRTLCGANLVTYPADFRGVETRVLHKVVARKFPLSQPPLAARALSQEGALGAPFPATYYR